MKTKAKKKVEKGLQRAVKAAKATQKNPSRKPAKVDTNQQLKKKKTNGIGVVPSTTQNELHVGDETIQVADISAVTASEMARVRSSLDRQMLGGIVCEDSYVSNYVALYQGDAVSIAQQLPERSVDYCLHSPPFSSLYTYGDSSLDMGNSVDDAQFFEHYEYLAREIARVLRPGRLCSVHCKQLVDYRGRDGRAGLRDFRGEIIRLFEKVGLKFHSEVTIFKSPVTEMHRTKAHGLLYKQLRADSSFSRQGLAEYIVTFRRWANEGEEIRPITHTKESFTLEEWQNIAGPVWLDIDATDVLNVQKAREDKDEKHICPLAIPIIERCLRLWTNPDDIVWSPFAGIGSEGYVALKVRDATGKVKPRRFLGTELKASYFHDALKNIKSVEPNAAGQQLDLFEALAAQATA